ncbi:unnamed protein product [Amaranthus hypochondriacus]
MSAREDVETNVNIEEGVIEGKVTIFNGNNKGYPWMVYISTCVAVCGSYQFGACAGYSSPTQSSITSELHLSTAQFSLFGSILTFGAMFGAITSGPIADSLGRKWAMRVYVGCCIAGWLAIYFSKSSVLLDIGRTIGGYGMGAFSLVVPVYIAEIAPVNIRGALTTLNQVMISTGIAVAFLIGLVISWRALALAGLIPCAIMLLGLFFIPESPRWLAKRGHQEEFKAALQKLWGCDADVTLEAAAIQSCIEELKQHPKASIFDLFQKKYVHCVTIGVGLMVLQQIGGINGICFYASNIFETAGFSPKIGTIVYGLIQVLIPSIGATLIDKTGRKPLLLVSAIGSALGCMLTAIAFYRKVHHEHTNATGILAATGILVYIAFYSVGIGPVPWVVMSEIFPINVKGVAGSLATLVNWFGAWAVSYTFNFLMEWSSYGTFFLFGVSNALGIIFVIKVVPETNGRTLEQIQLTIKG